MRMRTLQISLLVICSILFIKLSAQNNGYTTGLNGTVIDLPCEQNCVTQPFQIPHLKTTSDYTVQSIPYNPFPYVTAAGNEVVSVYDDDLFSEEIALPFSFCFYDSVFTSVVIGSNGMLTLDPSNAGCSNSWSVSDPIPFTGGVRCSPTDPYYPRASIMGVYADLDPRFLSSPPDRKIEWRIEGTAPFRRFIASFYHIGAYQGICGISSTNTFQMVLYESSGIIDIYVEQKGCPSGDNGGRAIMGLQNWYRDKAIAAPAKNNTVWAENNTAYRFFPSGSVSRFVKAEALLLDGTLVDLADTATTVNNKLDLDFTNLCVPGSTGQYVIRSTFGSCGNPAGDIISLDTITINKTNKLNPTISTSQTSCGVVGTGSATIRIPQGTGTVPFTFVLNPGNITQNSFSGNTLYTGLTAGNYTLDITDAASVCVTHVTFTITSIGVLPISFTALNTSCEGATNGSIIIDPPVGTPPLAYSINGGAFSPNNVFTGLAPASYLIDVQDGAGCTANNIPVRVDAGDPITMTTTTIPTSCPGLNNGSITVTGSSGTSPFVYSINGGSFSPTNVFSPLAPATYFISLKDAIGCTVNLEQVTVAQGNATITGTMAVAPATCNGVNNGSITVTPITGTGPYDYSINNGTNWQASNIFNGLIPGSYTIFIREGGTCTSNGIAVTVPAAIALTGKATPTDITCNGAMDGRITVVPDNGSGPYKYVMNSGASQLSNIFNGVGPGTQSITITDAAGCVSAPVAVIIAEPALLVAPVPTVSNVSCNGLSDGIITITPSGGTSPYSYSIDNTAFQAGNTFKVPQGIYTVHVRDKNGCRIQFSNVTVTQPAPLTAGVASTSNATCNGGNDGSIEVIANGGTAAYQYSADGATFQSSNILKVKAGTYHVVIKDGSSCTFDLPNVTVGLTDNLTLAATNPSPICEGTTVRLQLTSNATRYTWSMANPGLSNLSVADPIASPSVTTTYNVTAQLGVCSKTTAVTVTVLPAPVANAGADGEICYGQDFRLQGSGGTAYNWSPVLYLDDATQAATDVIRPLKTITYSLIVTDANNCQSLKADQVVVTVVPPIKITISPVDTVVYAGAQFQLHASSAGSSYVWSPATGLDNPTIADPVVTASSVGTETIYRVVTTNAAGCQGEGFAKVRVYEGPEVYVPNAFTPNHDGRNDEFMPFSVGIKQLNYFRVFNRWGQLLYSTTTLQNGWDGKMGGKEQAGGVYVWVLQAITEKGTIINKQGTVTLIR